MPAARRDGDVLEVKGRALPFSYFPVRRGLRRPGLFDVLFASSPWAVMRGAINRELKGGHREEALAFLEQGHDFYEAATGRLSTNPLLLYYAFLNVAKALIRVRGFEGDLDRASHGLFENHDKGTADIAKSRVVVETPSDRASVYSQLLETLGFEKPKSGSHHDITALLPQVVVGHRLWREASGRTERFVGLEKIEIGQARDAREIWLWLYTPRGDLDRYGIGHAQLIAEGGMEGVFREVRLPRGQEDLYGMICLEQTTPLPYRGRATDDVAKLVEPMRELLWRIVTTVPESGYRKYYVHLTPDGEPAPLPQIASLWALMFFFGSVVRYRPHVFAQMSRERYGAFITEFVSGQGEQLLYMLASEMCQREIAKPAVI